MIDQYVETLCGGSDTSYLYKGKCLPMGTYNAGMLDGNPAQFLTTVHGPVQRLRDGRGREGGDLREALQPQQGRARPALQPQAVHGPGEERQDLLQGGGADAADLQLVLHRQQGDRRLHQRPAPDQASRGGSGAAHEGHGQVRVERLPEGRRPSPGHRRQGRHDRQLEPGPGQGLRRRRRRVGPQRLGGAQRPAHRKPEAPAEPARASGHRPPSPQRDERRGHPGHPRDRHGSAPGEGAEGLDRALRAGTADVEPAVGLAGATAAAAWTATTTARSTIRGRRSWTSPSR